MVNSRFVPLDVRRGIPRLRWEARIGLSQAQNQENMLAFGTTDEQNRGKSHKVNAALRHAMIGARSREIDC